MVDCKSFVYCYKMLVWRKYSVKRFDFSYCSNKYRDFVRKFVRYFIFVIDIIYNCLFFFILSVEVLV